jgi:uncharacterized membrane protein
MANIKISELPGLSVLAEANQFPVVSSGVTFNVTANVMQTFMSNVATAITVNRNSTDTAIINGGTTGVGNIGAAGATFNTVFARATTAEYADLAECYSADADYAPGTVVSFGGTAEVTLCNQTACPRVAGVISTNPAYLMNSAQDGTHIATVALVGRVPCRIQGPVKAGDMMVSAGNGTARAEANPAMGTVIGKAVQSHAGGFGTIEIVVGRL